MATRLSPDPRLQNINNELVEIVVEQFQSDIDLVFLHLRDARNILAGVANKETRALAKAAILLASAGLESNLVYLSRIGVRFAEKHPRLFAAPQLQFLRGAEKAIDDNGQIVERPLKQPLSQRLRVVPTLLARVIGREYRLRTDSASYRKLQRTIQRRDAIVHPRWDRYVTEVGWWEAAEAIDSVELYLNSVASALHPHLTVYFHVLYTIPGYDHDEVAVGHRTLGKRGPQRQLVTMADVGIPKVLLNEWFDAMLLVHLALDSECEGDSGGSMLTRAALILVYAMLDAQLAVVAQWRMNEALDAFDQAEVLFLNELAVGIGHDGEVWLGEDHQSFKKRIKAVPAILSRRVDGKEANIDLSRQWGNEILIGNELRNNVMHSRYGKPLPRITKRELLLSFKAVFEYFEELSKELPTSFEYVKVLLGPALELIGEFSSSYLAS
jgi:hypothetical protein